MRLTQPQIHPLERYTSYGSQRPPVNDLLTMVGVITSHPNSATALLYASDMCLDLAFADRSKADHWIDQSKQALKAVVSASEAVLTSSTGNLNGTAERYLVAKIRLAELKNWGKAAREEPIQGNYKTLRSACRQALPLIDRSEDLGPRLLEVMPILLGARAKAQDSSKGWFGRLALLREDKGSSHNGSDKNFNWDAGISLSNSPQQFEKPDIKLQVKASDADHHSFRYAKAGVALLIANEYGLSDPAGIIVGCLKEAGQETTDMESEGVSPLPSSQLDEVTAALGEKIAKSSSRAVAIKSRLRTRL